MKVAPTVILSALAASVLFGLFSQELLMAKDIGFNMAALCAILLGAFLVLRSKKVIDFSFHLGYLVVPLVVAIYGFAVPDSRGLDTLNLAMVILSLGYCALRSAVNRPLSLVESIGKVPALICVIPFAGFTMPWLADWTLLAKIKKLSFGRGALVGCIAAVPFLAVFGNILAQADPVFGRIFSFDMSINPETFIIRMLLFGFTSCFFSGLIIYLSRPMFAQINVFMALQPDPSKSYSVPIGPPMVAVAPPRQVPSRESEHVATFVTFFGLLAAMFLIFVLVQLRYLFGGDSVVLQTAQLTYAEYARRGFLEIVGVAAVCLPMIIFSQYALRNFDEKARKAINVVVVIIVSLLLLLLASAALRLKLYVGAYGLSPLRVYVAAGMLWLLILFGTYLRYGTQWKLDKIGKVVYASMVLITLGLNFAKPDYWIARVNLTRRKSKDIDPNMILDAGADAQSAIAQYGKGKTTPDENKQDYMSAFQSRQITRAKSWKDLTISQLMLSK